MSKEKKVIISLKDIVVKFSVRGKLLKSIRNVSFDIYDGETIAIVGESGSGKSVLTKTLTNMIESNGYISNGSVMYYPTQATKEDEESAIRNDLDLVNLHKGSTSSLTRKIIKKNNIKIIKNLEKKLKDLRLKVLQNQLEFLNVVINKINQKNDLINILHKENEANLISRISVFLDQIQAFQNCKEIAKDFANKWSKKIKTETSIIDKSIKKLIKIDLEKSNLQKQKNAENEVVIKLENKEISLQNIKKINELLGVFDHGEVADLVKEIENKERILQQSYFEMSSFVKLNITSIFRLKKVMREISKKSNNLELVNKSTINSALKYLSKRSHLSTFESNLKSVCEKTKTFEPIEDNEVSFLMEQWTYQTQSNFKNKKIANKKLRQIRGGTIATIFQDPMTSLNPLLSVGHQITEAILLHSNVTRHTAKKEALELMQKVGITNPEKRFHDIPGKYSGGMRQRIVIAIALACKPKVLICDEPTTALDVTIQAQILELIKELKEEYNLTIIFITHDLGVVANVADRVAVLYAGQIIEYGTVNDIFFDAKHPYTWALLSALPQLGTKGEELYAINGTPPSLFNEIKGDAFAPRNDYALEIDFKYNPPMFEVSPTHGARTWLLDSRAKKVNKPKNLNNLRSAIEEAKVGE